MLGSTNIDSRQSNSSGSRRIGKEYHFRRLEIIKKIEGVCHTGMKDLHGEVMEIYLGTREGLIIDASFLTSECSFGILSGYMVSKLAIGTTADEALKIDANAILESLGQIPEKEVYFTRLAAEALHAAIHSWIYSEKEPSAPQEVKNER